jgi:hypothetical protein
MGFCDVAAPPALLWPLLLPCASPVSFTPAPSILPRDRPFAGLGAAGN